MKVKKQIPQGVMELIKILVDLFDEQNNAVDKIQHELLKFNGGEIVHPDYIFGSWADPKPKHNDPHKIVKKVCAIIKDEMFE